MRKKQRLVRIKSGETHTHPVGRERFVSIQRYTGDLPSGEPTDWFESVDELEKILEYERAGYEPGEADELLKDEWLIDEY